MRTRAGLTIVELLVVISLIALLVAMLLPAVFAAREASRKNTCLNNTNQIAKGLISYESAFGSFPPGATPCSDVLKTAGKQAGNFCSGPNWAGFVLPYVEQNADWEKIMECAAATRNVCDDCEHAPWMVGTYTPGVFHCPSVRTTSNHTSMATQLENVAKGTYAACYGSWNYSMAIEGGPAGWNAAGVPDLPGKNGPHWKNAVGVFSVVPVGLSRGETYKPDREIANGIWKVAQRRGVSTAAVRDGLSKTLMTTEIVPCDIRADLRGAWTCGAMGGAAITAYNTPNAKFGSRRQHPLYPDHNIIYGDQFFGCDDGCSGDLKCRSDDQNGAHWVSARSNHRGGVITSRADGSAQFVSDEIAIEVWQSLAARGDEG